ncbi:type IV pilus modification protein PilV [Pseudomonas sp. PIC25]|nr:type IV pilus modification protein PilV [Pseudomonas sp. PIC25]
MTGLSTRFPRFHGFSMIEVLVGLVLTCIGVLGMVALQARSIHYTQSAVNHNQAILLADNLLEMMRSNPSGALTDDLFTTSSTYYKAPGSAFASTSTSLDECLSRDRSNGGSTVATADLDCWRQEVQSLLPVTDDALEASFAICPSASPDSCSASGSSVVMIQIAWTDNSGECDDNLCIYRLRSEL